MANSITIFGNGNANYGKFHSRLSGTENSREFPGNSREIPGKFHSHLRERECKWKIPFPFLGTGMRVANSIPDFRDGNWRPVFPGIPGIGNSRSWLNNSYLTNKSDSGQHSQFLRCFKKAVRIKFFIIFRNNYLYRVGRDLRNTIIDTGFCIYTYLWG